MSTSEHAGQDLDIAAVSRLSGVTSRTLRHYDAIGLLRPAWTGDDGRRHYGPPELQRLQHILVLRELGTPLPTIQSLVDTDDDEATIALLRQHRRALEQERDRFATLAATVDNTIAALELGVPMTSDDILNGFNHDRYAPEARERWGAPVVDRAYSQWRDLSPDAQSDHLAEHGAISQEIARLAASGANPAGASAQEVVARHFGWVSLLWTPNAESYTGLGQMYVDDARFKKTYDKYGAGTAQFLSDAMAEFAKRLP